MDTTNGIENNCNEHWVAERLSSLDPQWQPDPVVARQLLSSRLEARRGAGHWVRIAVPVAVCIAVAALPQTRAIGQGIWDRLVLNRVQAVRVDLSRLPLRMHITENGIEQSVSDADQAERVAGFKPYLPPPGTLNATPAITVAGPMVMEQTIHVRDLQSALDAAGATDLQVPAEWENATLRSDVGAVVNADYPGGIQIAQMRPVELSIPAGFPLERLAEAAFRSAGLSWADAQTLARDYAANPAWLVDIPADQLASIQELALPAGPALLIERFDQTGSVDRATILRSVSERVYSVSSPTRALSVTIANSLP
jgi:hypothetical protein